MPISHQQAKLLFFKQLSIADEMTIDSEFEKYRDGIFLIMERVIAE
jgi:hypothetical protein